MFNCVMGVILRTHADSCNHTMPQKSVHEI